MAVIFKTPGNIDMRAFIMDGVNVKPNTTNPIGRFGTGLKYSVAVLLRLGLQLDVYFANKHYNFYTRSTEFRDEEFQQVMLKNRTATWKDKLFGKPSYQELAYTTQRGRDWELWMVFRELHSNTLDEGGETYVYGDNAVDDHIARELLDNPNQTLIVVKGSLFREVYDRRGEIFLEIEGMEPVSSDEDIVIYEKPSKYAYYRGLRVYEFKEPAQFTYNVLRYLKLTEDRTLQWSFELENLIAQHTTQSRDKKFIQKQLASLETRSFEASITRSYISGVPSDVYIEAARTSANPTAREAVKPYTPKEPDTSIQATEFQIIPGQHYEFTYTNWKNETEVRRVQAIALCYGDNPYHGRAVWYLRARCTDKNAERSFHLPGIKIPTIKEVQPSEDTREKEVPY